jgi:hypothetical protein
MSKDAYFEMCEQLGEEPLEHEIPLELSDFPELVQQCFVMYGILSDNWDSMGGNYLGKDYSIVFKLFDIYQVSDPSEKLLSLDFMQHIDNVRAKLISDKIKAK